MVVLLSRSIAGGDRRGSGLAILSQHGVDAPPCVVEDVPRLGDLILGAGPYHLDYRRPELKGRVAQARRAALAFVRDLLPRRTVDLLRLRPAGVGQRETPLALRLLAGHEALVLEQLERGIDGARARPP